jgi:hypothetical protein
MGCPVNAYGERVGPVVNACPGRPDINVDREKSNRRHLEANGSFGYSAFAAG